MLPLAFLFAWLWVWAIGSWCMCFYVIFASCEGARWFDARRNPFLIVGALGGVVASLFGQPVPCTSIFITCLGWSCYSALVTMQHIRSQSWRRHIVPVNIPGVALLVWFMFHC